MRIEEKEERSTINSCNVATAITSSNKTILMQIFFYGPSFLINIE